MYTIQICQRDRFHVRGGPNDHFKPHAQLALAPLVGLSLGLLLQPLMLIPCLARHQHLQLPLTPPMLLTSYTLPRELVATECMAARDASHPMRATYNHH